MAARSGNGSEFERGTWGRKEGADDRERGKGWERETGVGERDRGGRR